MKIQEVEILLEELKRELITTAIDAYDNVDFNASSSYNPKKIGRGYKLFEYRGGNLYPLFIGKKEPTPIGVWLKAKNIPTKSFAKRPGWHIGSSVPDAPWLKSDNDTDVGYYKSKYKSKDAKRVWAEVEFPADINYQSQANESKTRDLPETIPVDGYYLFKEGQRGTWIVTGAIKVKRIIPQEEISQILAKMNYDEAKAFAPYKEKLKKYKESIAKKKVSKNEN